MRDDTLEGFVKDRGKPLFLSKNTTLQVGQFIEESWQGRQPGRRMGLEQTPCAGNSRVPCPCAAFTVSPAGSRGVQAGCHGPLLEQTLYLILFSTLTLLSLLQILKVKLQPFKGTFPGSTNPKSSKSMFLSGSRLWPRPSPDQDHGGEEAPQRSPCQCGEPPAAQDHSDTQSQGTDSREQWLTVRAPARQGATPRGRPAPPVGSQEATPATSRAKPITEKAKQRCLPDQRSRTRSPQQPRVLVAQQAIHPPDGIQNFFLPSPPFLMYLLCF